MKFTETQLEKAIISLLEAQGCPYHRGESLARDASEVLLKDDLHSVAVSAVRPRDWQGGAPTEDASEIPAIGRTD